MSLSEMIFFDHKIYSTIQNSIVHLYNAFIKVKEIKDQNFEYEYDFIKRPADQNKRGSASAGHGRSKTSKEESGFC